MALARMFQYLSGEKYTIGASHELKADADHPSS